MVTGGTTLMTFLTLIVLSLDNLGRVTELSVISSLLATFLLSIRNSELKFRLHQNTLSLDSNCNSNTFTAGQKVRKYSFLYSFCLGFLTLLPASLYFLAIQNLEFRKNRIVYGIPMSNFDKNLITSVASHAFSNLIQLG